MKHVMIRYRVKPTAPWRTRNSSGLSTPNCTGHSRTDSVRDHQLDDGVSFVHVATHATRAESALRPGSFQWFQKDIADRCDEPPALSELREIGSTESDARLSRCAGLVRTA